MRDKLKEILGAVAPVRDAYYRLTTWAFNPSRLLRLMLVVLLAAFAAFVALEKGAFDNTALAAYKIGMLKSEWIYASGILLAAVGWLVSSIVTIRNSVKQHSINTLLQTRLSATYQDKAMDVRAGLPGHTPTNRAPLATITADPKTQQGVEYLLNYVEFMAVGIRHGDLHEGVMKDSMRGIVVRFTQIALEFVQDCRSRNGPRTYQNLIWLYNRWREYKDPAI